jgi:hypothetical protein
MKQALSVALVRNDGKPDNGILGMLDMVKQHGFELADTPQYFGGPHRLVHLPVKWVKSDRRTTRRASLAALASALGQATLAACH